jgi:hypothetical protein
MPATQISASEPNSLRSATKAYIKFVRPNAVNGKQEPGSRLEYDKRLWLLRNEIHSFSRQGCIAPINDTE